MDPNNVPEGDTRKQPCFTPKAKNAWTRIRSRAHSGQNTMQPG